MIRRVVLLPGEWTAASVIAVAGFLAVELVWVGFPLWNRLVRLREEAAASQAQLARLRMRASPHPARDAIAQTFAAFWVAEPDSTIQRRFLEELEQLTRANELRVSMTPKPFHPEGTARRYLVEVSVEGTELAILACLERLLSGSSWIELEQFHVAPTGSKDAPLKGTFLVSKVVARTS